MPTAKQSQALNLYTALMQEVKIRANTVNLAALGGMQFLPPQIVQEFSFLQIRLICELIALSCLVDHGDIKGTEAPKLQKEYAPAKIIDALEKLHPGFFPRPVMVTQLPDGSFHAIRGRGIS